MGILIALAALTSTGPHETKMALWMNGQLIGHGTMGMEVDTAGRLHHRIRSTMKMGDAERVMDYESICDRKGCPISETETDTLGEEKTLIRITTGSKEITIEASMGGETKSTKVKIPKGNISDPSGFWFITQKPKRGQKVTSLQYKAATGKWEKETVTYVGDSLVPGMKIKAHHIKSSDNDQWMDDKGQLWRVDQTINNGIKLSGIREK